MGLIDLPEAASGVSGYTSLSSPYEGSISNPLSGWDPIPIVEETPWRRKAMFLRNDKKALMRYEIDKEGPHLHYEKNSYKIKIRIPELRIMTLQEFLEKFPELKQKGNGIIKSLKRKANKSN